MNLTWLISTKHSAPLCTKDLELQKLHTWSIMWLQRIQGFWFSYYAGGAITIGIDRDGLDEYVRLNPSLETLDDFVTTLIADTFIPEMILRSCRVSANLLDTGDLHMVLENLVTSENTCRMFVETMANDINNPPRNNGSMTTTAVPQV